MTTTEDRRVRKTKKAISEALAKLLLEKPLNSISVKEISDMADINRGTFYLHYRDVYDMAEKLQNEIFEKFNSIVDHYDSVNEEDELFPMLIDFYNLLSDNSALAKVLIGKNGDAAFVDKMKQVIREKCFEDLKKTFGIKNNDELDYVYHYIISGCIGIFGAWLNNGMRETPSEMAAVTRKLILTGGHTLSENDNV